MITNDNLKVTTILVPGGIIAAGGLIGTAPLTVDVASSFVFTQTVPMVATATLPSPTDAQAGDRLSIGNSSSSTQDILVNSVVINPGKFFEFDWSGSAWLALTSVASGGGLGTVVTVPGGIPVGNSTVTHNLGLPPTKFSWVIAQALNSVGSEVVIRRNTSGDTSNAMGVFSAVAVTGPITYYITSLV